MDNIKSFELDHDSMKPGFYELGESNGVVTFDMRFKYPNQGDYISYDALHSIEHLFAVVIRNSPIKEKVVYFGPMGCRTGCYLLLYKIHKEQALPLVKECLQQCLQLDYVPGTKKIECGNYKEHDLKKAQEEISNYLKVLQGE